MYLLQIKGNYGGAPIFINKIFNKEPSQNILLFFNSLYKYDGTGFGSECLFSENGINLVMNEIMVNKVNIYKLITELNELFDNYFVKYSLEDIIKYFIPINEDYCNLSSEYIENINIYEIKRNLLT